MGNSTELTLFSDGSGTLFTADGQTLHDFETLAQFAAFFD